MRLAFIGTVEFSKRALELLLDCDAVDVVGVVTLGESDFHSDFADLRPLAETRSIPCLLADQNDPSALAEWLGERAPEIVYCFGWSRLLPSQVLRVAPRGVVGFHPAALPQNRGRHPIIWALALGLDRTASTFFYMDEGADSGDILSQQAIIIEPEDDAGSLYQKVTATALDQIPRFTREIAEGGGIRVPQAHEAASYWRKRDARDGMIDWRMSMQAIDNLVRALARPYDGATTEFEGRQFRVWKVRPAGIGQPNDEPGKVLDADDGVLVVKCADGALLLTDHEIDQLPSVGQYLR